MLSSFAWQHPVLKFTKKTLKNTVLNAIKNQTGGGARQRRKLQQRPWKQICNRSNKLTKSAKNPFFFVLQAPRRSWWDFLLRWKVICDFILTEAIHSSLNLSEKSSRLVTFDGSYCRKLFPLYNPNGSMLESDVAFDRNKSIKRQKNFL